MTEKNSTELRNMVAYVIAGIAATALNFFLFWVFIDLLHWETNLSNTLSVIITIFFAYFCNKIFVFRTHTSGLMTFLREITTFFASRFVTMLIEIGGVFFFCTVLHFEPLIVKIALNVVVIVLNYVFSKFIVFRK